MEYELLLKAIEKMLDEKLDRKFDEKLEPIKKELADIKSNQETILSFIKQADTEFLKLNETVKFVDKLKKVMNE
ncbi:hypothetical protein [Fonticella tunisiensis]|uniref:Uncharacterized protein n=1 Tax=Fonticella tunisiensis TaxID=1096341 RepID=A0A4R7KAT6_9CLOT|nr:hypothetical protein [Fonticella tunisiensis]TDT52002.1 hypothetical protein EDD71_11533 [Fonticella tunisiensis]